MPRRHSPTSGQAVRARTREQKAVALRMGGSTYDEIGRVLGISRAAAHKAVTRAMAQIARDAKEDAAVLRDIEARRLDDLQLAIWSKAIAGDTDAIDAAMKIMGRRARLLGLDAPTNHRMNGPVALEITGANGGPVRTEAVMSPEDRRARIDQLTRAIRGA